MHTVGKEHPNIATAYHNIGLSLLKKGILEEALEYFRKSLKIKLKVYDSMNTNLAHLYGSFSHAHKLLGNFDKSVEYQRKCLNIWSFKVGDIHPNIAVCYESIADILCL